MATFSRLLFLFPSTPPRSLGEILHRPDHEQPSPFMHANVGGGPVEV